MTPAGVIRPILPLEYSVNHKFRSGPVTIPRGELDGVGKANSVIEPLGVMRPIL
jgi:hypothetical protein